MGGWDVSGMMLLHLSEIAAQSSREVLEVFQCLMSSSSSSDGDGGSLELKVRATFSWTSGVLQSQLRLSVRVQTAQTYSLTKP